MKASILDRLLIVFTGHVDASNPGSDFATPEGLEAHMLGTAGLTFGGDNVMGSDVVSLGDGVRRFDKFLVFILKGENVVERYSDISTFQPLIVASKRRESVVRCHGAISSRTDSLN